MSFWTAISPEVPRTTTALLARVLPAAKLIVLVSASVARASSAASPRATRNSRMATSWSSTARRKRSSMQKRCCWRVDATAASHCRLESGGDRVTDTRGVAPGPARLAGRLRAPCDALARGRGRRLWCHRRADVRAQGFSKSTGLHVFFSVLACVLVAIQQQAGKLGFAIALVSGVLIGLTAKWWGNANIP